MHKKNMTIAQEYYTAMSKKDIISLEKFLDPNILFVAPLATVTGKQAFVETLKKFITFFTTLTIRAQFGSEDQAMIVYTLDFSQPIGAIETSALLSLKDGLITKIELFYDARPFTK